MTFWFGVLIFALGILVSVCLHEAGHMVTAKSFGMKVTQYFAGFGPTLWSFRRGETEYGVKAIPAGGFVKIIGMTPLEDKLAPTDEHRAFWRAPVWQRTVVLVAGSAMHFLLAGFIFFGMAFTTGLPNPALATYDAFAGAPVIGQVSNCVVPGYELNADKDNFRACTPADPVGPAKAAGLLPGDRLLSVGGKPTETYGDVVEVVRASPAGPVQVVYERDGERRTTTTDLVSTQRPATGDTTGTKLVTVSAIGVSPDAPVRTLNYGVLGAVPASIWYVGETIKQTFQAIGNFPSKIPNLIDSIGGEERDQATPISVVGASRIGGEAAELGLPIVFLTLLGGLNVFIGVFNLFPLLPLDGGHVAIIWFEKVRSWWASRRGLPDPGRVDYNKLLPVTYVVLLIFGGLTLLTLTADIVNPIRLG